MSCQDKESRDTLLQHLKHHVIRTCPKCQLGMQPLPGALPFGNAMMITWECKICKSEDVTVMNEDGTLLEISKL